MTHASIATRALGRAMSYIAPRLDSRSRGLDISAMFESLTRENYRQSIPSLVNSIVAATDGMLAYDANTQELTQELQSVAPQPTNAGVPHGGYSEELIQRVLELLRPRVTASELLAYEKILRGNKAKPAAQSAMPSVMGEDAYRPPRFTQDQRAREDFYSRFPTAKRMRVEPSYNGPPPRAPTPVRNDPSVAPFSERFPGVRAPKHV